MSISTLAQSIATSPTLALNEEAGRLRQKGEAVINLGIGEPKNKTPMTAVLSATACLNTGDIKYAPTEGLPSLKKAIVRYTEKNYDRAVLPGNVIVSAGAKQALYNILYTILNPRDEVLILAPYWVSYPEMVKMCYGVPVVVKPRDGGVHPRMEDIAASVTPATRAIIVNSPNNPSGAIFSDDLICELVEYCERKGIYYIADDIYHQLVFDAKKAAPAYRFSSRDVESSNIIVVNGVSKTYGMTGFRIGWAIAPRPLIEIMGNVQAQTISCASPLLQAGAEGALDGDQGVVGALRQTMQDNRDLVVQKLQSFAGLQVRKPEGTFYCFPDFSAYNRDSVALSRFLLQKALVVTVPGKEFGMEGYLRLSYAGSAKDVTEGIDRIKWALDPTSPSEIHIGVKKMVRDWM